MKFQGELKFPEVDHPGVPVSFVIDDDQAELVVDGESLGRWSLYDIHARRLVASAFQIDLDGTEVTFVAQDPIDFAYRGVEHMAGSWATIKSKRLATRSLAIRKSRKGITTPRLEDLRSAMEANLESLGPRAIAGQATLATDATVSTVPADGAPVEAMPEDWDRRDQSASIPLVGAEAVEDEPEVEAAAELPEVEAAEAIVEPVGSVHPEVAAAQAALEEERRRLAEERERLELDRRAAEEREANLVEAYRLEVQRLEEERADLRRTVPEPEPVVEESAAPEARFEEPVDVEAPALQPEVAPDEIFASEAEPESEPESELEPEPVPEPDFEPALEAGPEPEPEDVFAPEPEPEPVGRQVVDLNEYEESAVLAPEVATSLQPDLEPAMAGMSKERRGIMGAVKAAFRSGPRDHVHQFIEAPGGLGITRYVCEECGYVSIGAGD